MWQADHLALDTPCAVKFIDESVAGREDLRSRFRQEAHAAAKLRSPNVVQMFDYGEHEGALFIVMELLEGETLAERLDSKGWLSASQTVRVLRDVARALVKAQMLGIVHRDLKPRKRVHRQGR